MNREGEEKMENQIIGTKMVKVYCLREPWIQREVAVHLVAIPGNEEAARLGSNGCDDSDGSETCSRCMKSAVESLSEIIR